MKHQLMKLTLLGILMLVSMSPVNVKAAVVVNEQALGQKHCISQATVELKENMRKLWLDHVIWTRSYIVSAIAGLEDQEEVLARLLKNQQDIGNANSRIDLNNWNR